MKTEPLERRSFGRVDVVVMFVLGCICFGFATSAIGFARFNARARSCQDNLRNLATASILYDGRLGRYPGYMNALLTVEGKPYVDPRTGKSAPVSWAVELLCDLDRFTLYDQWRQAPSTTGGAANTQYLTEPFDQVVCPDDTRSKTGPLLSYVVNSGRKDLPSASPATANPTPKVGLPRDWAANGVFFDYYSDDKFVKTEAATRGPTVVMRSGQIRDPKDKTIMFTENLDAGSYVFESRQVPNGDPALAEIVWGSILEAGKIDPSTMPPTMKPDAPAIPINAQPRTALKPGYEYCRPSSSHVGGVNVAFTARNVAFLNNDISYFIFAKLMASDDAGIRTPGSTIPADSTLRMYQLVDTDLEP